MIVGIDLGTTNSAIAYITDRGPELIPNALGNKLTPSTIAFPTEGSLLVGESACEYQVLHPERCASLFKRHMGSDWSFSLDERTFAPEELSGLLLKSLRHDAEAYLGTTVDRAVITVPAYFNDDQRKATIRAGQLAGLQVERIINEPTAAAIAYGLHEAHQDKTIVVFDLGGGTFDVSVVDLFEGMIEVRASSGESFLGGEDFTRLLAARVLGEHGIIYERAEVQNPLQVARMLQLCERAKCRLTAETSVGVTVPDQQGDLKEDASKMIVTRKEFQTWTESILARIELPLRRALGDVNLSPSLVDEVILVGGATRMPAVRDRVEAYFQQVPSCRFDPDEVVALGAAVQAGLIDEEQSLEDVVVTDVAPFTLGVDVSKRFGLEQRAGYFSPIIHRNTTIPVSRMSRYGTTHSNQTEMQIGIYQGESRRVSDNHKLGELLVKGIPRGPAGQQVDIRMTYDLNGVLEVEATVVDTGEIVKTVIARHAHGLTDAEIAAAVEVMQALKTHPREEAENHFLLRRAERLYRELAFQDRDRLAELLDGFEAVLEMQDREAIQRTRRRLKEFLEQFDRDDIDSHS